MIAGSQWTGCIDAVTPRAAMRRIVASVHDSRCSMRGVRIFGPLTRTHSSTRSSAISLARSPIACMASCRPAASAATATGAAVSNDQIGSAFDPSAYGARIAAVHASMTPSRMNFTPVIRNESVSNRSATRSRTSAARATAARSASGSPVGRSSQCALTGKGSRPSRSSRRRNVASSVSPRAISVAAVTPVSR
ncbi:Uncharacterised protein [Mycobacteroides abscessus subsp. abscessus]|nr:Uncharacterised protein [Mycobacteroides abscessus subsp. abscessus]